MAEAFYIQPAGQGAGVDPDGATMYVGWLDSAARTELFDGAFLPAYANGFLLFVRDDTLMAQSFDADRLELAGEPRTLLAEPLLIGGAPATSGVFAVAQSGVLVYQAGLVAQSALVWLDRGGRELGILGEPDAFSYVQLSPDERHLAVSVVDAALRTRDLWLYDTTRRGARTRLTFEPSDDFAAAWSQSGDRLAFAARRSGDRDLNLYEAARAGSVEKRLLNSDGVEIPTSWSHDGRFLLFQTPSPGADIMIVSLAADAQVSAFANTRFTEGSAQFSPDGRWVAYSSNESGRTEVYAAPFQHPGTRVTVSTDGGGSPRWGHHMKELFYIRSDNTLMSVAIDATEASVEIGAVTELFQTRFHGAAFPYAVASDGRFLVNRSVSDATAPPITLFVNWPAALGK